MKEAIEFKGRYKVEVIRDGEVVQEVEGHNLVTTAGKNTVLDIAFRAQTQISQWYIGLVDQTNFATQLVTDTMSAHAGWVEWTAYVEAARQAWTTTAAANGQIQNTTPATFNMNAGGTLNGIFIASGSIKGGTTGTLWSVVSFTSTVPVLSGDQIKVTYILGA